MIYFIGTDGHVKIGHSKTPRKRLASLSTGCPTECTLVAVLPGGVDEEAALHQKFSHLRSRGEWFRFDAEIMDFIRDSGGQVPAKTVRARRTAPHALISYLERTGRSMTEIAKRAGYSRMTLYRLVRGEQNATIELLTKVSGATDGEVPVSAFLPKVPAEAHQ